jgi:indole-3-glycerol phosphate synthase
MNQLEKILRHKRKEVAERKEAISVGFLQSQSSVRAAPRNFIEALRAAPMGMGLIAEIKRKSPSAGRIRRGVRVDHIAEQYQEAGAQALSILADSRFFGGKESDFVEIRDVTDIPVLYKEFVVDSWQVWHAAALGAAAVLLIVAALPGDELASMLDCVRRARLTALVEVHTAEDLARIQGLDVPCVGINNRDLTTFEVSLDTTFRLREAVPDGALVVSESGIRSADDVVRLKTAGVEAVLVGEHLLRQDHPGQAIKELMSGVWTSS